MGGAYPLTQLPAEETGVSRMPLTGVFTVQPFMLDGSAYVSLTDGRAEWTVIAQYRGGGRFEDLCYLRAAVKQGIAYSTLYPLALDRYCASR